MMARGYGVVAGYLDGALEIAEGDYETCAIALDSGRLVPDLDHPATRGWLLAMLREATECDDVVITRSNAEIGGIKWVVDVYDYSRDTQDQHEAPTEGEALARALLAAWDAEEVRGG